MRNAAMIFFFRNFARDFKNVRLKIGIRLWQRKHY